MFSGVAEPQRRHLFALPEVVLCLEGKVHTLPVGVCSVGCHRRRWCQATVKTRWREVTEGRLKHWLSIYIWRVQKVHGSQEANKSFSSQYEPKWDECLARAVNKARKYSCMNPLATVCLHFLCVFQKLCSILVCAQMKDNLKRSKPLCCTGGTTPKFSSNHFHCTCIGYILVASVILLVSQCLQKKAIMFFA